MCLFLLILFRSFTSGQDTVLTYKDCKVYRESKRKFQCKVVSPKIEINLDYMRTDIRIDIPLYRDPRKEFPREMRQKAISKR